MIHLGDITKINGADAPVVDCIIGGSPCQDLSIAGKRAGLAGERSGLYMDQIRIVKEMRAHDKANGRSGRDVRPRYMVWENVPGAFSSNKGRDFAAVIEEAIRVVEPQAPAVPVPAKGWPTAGVVMGDGWSIAWRVLDAQFWGVPQPRRRIALVADFGGRSAPEILFERKSLYGDPEPSRETREGFAANTEKRADGASYAVRIRGGCDGGAKGALVQKEVSGTYPRMRNDQTIFCLQENGVDRAVGKGSNNSVFGIHADIISRGAKAMCGGGWIRDDTMYTLVAKGPHGVYDMSHANDVIRECGETVPTLQSRMGTGGNQVPLVYAESQFGAFRQGVGTLKASGGANGGGSESLVVRGIDSYNGSDTGEVSSTLGAACGMSTGRTQVMKKKSVRRLTPLECERLQGFPGHWTDIGTWYDSKGKKHETSDVARYKALGNSIALPPWKWVLKRLCAQYERDATMASLFDGIGGFPLLWEQLNGEESCLWASEIEEFPIAVTSFRFARKGI